MSDLPEPASVSLPPREIRCGECSELLLWENAVSVCTQAGEAFAPWEVPSLAEAMRRAEVRLLVCALCTAKYDSNAIRE